MKRKVKIAIVPIILVIMLSYIEISTHFVNELEYRRLAWELVNHDKHVNDWQQGKVSVVKLNKSNRVIPLSGKINRFLLVLNGGYAVRVEFSTDQDGMLGPIVLYFNPFTKQCVGGDIRM